MPQSMISAAKLGIYQGQRQFVLGTLDLTRNTLGQVGAGSTVAGLVIAPFAPPVGGALLGIGGTLSTISGTSSVAYNLGTGNKGAAITDAVMLGVGAGASAGLRSLVGKGVITQSNELILRAVQDTSLEITGTFIVPELQKRNK